MRVFLASMAFSLVSWACLTKSAAAEPTAEEITQAIRELGADEFKVREKATEFLWKAGEAALPALEKAAQSPDIEVKFRAQGLLEKVRIGITPDMPADVAQLLESFRKGDQNVKRQVLMKLKEKGDTRLMLQVVRSEKDPAFQRFAEDFFRAEIDRLLPDLVVKGEFAQAEQLLVQSAVQDGGMQRLATWWLLRGKADEEIAKLRDRAIFRPDPSATRQLVWLLRAKGDLATALDSAKTLDDKPLIVSLAAENRDWKLAAKVEQEITRAAGAPLQDLVRLAALDRLAGNQAELDADIGEIAKRGEQPSETWLAAKGLLLNERPAEGLAILKKASPGIAQRLLDYRSEHAASLELAGIGKGTEFNREWYGKLAMPERATIGLHRFAYAATLMRQLNWLGRKDEALKLRALLLEVARDPDVRQLNGWGILAQIELQMGWETEALDDAAQALALPGGRSILSRFFPKQYAHAGLWWDFLRKQSPSEPPKETLVRLQKLLRPASAVDALPQWRELVEKAEAEAKVLDRDHRGQWMQVLADTCELRGNRELALKYAKVAADDILVGGLSHGQLLLADKQWDAAATAFMRVWELDRSQVLALHLAGRALVQAGEMEAGKQKMELASLLCLDAAVRRNLAYNLHERGFADDALPHYELTLRTGPVESWHVVNAAENLGNLVVKNDPLRAADMWERLELYLLSPNANPNEYEPLLDLSRLIHKTRAKGLLDAGKADEGLSEIKKCEVVAPGNVDVVEDMVPLLRKNDRAAEADALYERAYAIHSQLVQDFPDSPACRNNVAWISAVCSKRLDEALAHAEKAVELAPKSASYLDTLAEVHFQKGDRAKAVELGKQVVALAPQSKLFADRLNRFENDPLPSRPRQ